MGGAIRRGGAALLSVVAGLLSVLVMGSAAAAHNSLTGSDPKNGARLDQPPAQVRLTFLARLDPETTTITVTGPDNVPAAAGSPRFEGKSVEVDFRPGRAGLYTAAYEVASDDGHPVEGEVRFTLTVGEPVPSEPVPSVGSTAGATAGPAASATGPVAAAPATLASPGPPLRAASEDTDGGVPVWPFVVLGAGVLAALGGGAVALARRRRADRAAP
jgi:copper resistance protein C